MPTTIRNLVRAAPLAGAGKSDQAERLVQRASALAPPKAPRRRSTRTPPTAATPGAAAPAAAALSGSFTRHFFLFEGERYSYRLFVPAAPSRRLGQHRPLVVLLHGCEQDAVDFAQGTGMNALAQQHQCLVLYPEQLASANHMRCWNWFDRAHQSRGGGEPAMIAALTRDVLKARSGDPARVYIAGLSAGGAMALLVAQLYPELFAAAGVHSGLPVGAAGNAMSAFSAMRQGGPRSAAAAAGPPVPTIVFHGSEDRTVHPGNGEQVVQAALAGLDATGLDLVESNGPHEGADLARRTQRTRYSAADGISHVEHWAVDAGPHAWSGGNPAGSFTDPQGPGASAAMLAFFLQHRKA